MEDQARVPGHHRHHQRPTSSLLPRLKPRCPSNSFVSGCLAFQRTMGRLKDQSLNLAQVREPTNTRETYGSIWVQALPVEAQLYPQLENLIFVLEELEETREQVEMMYTGTDR